MLDGNSYNYYDESDEEVGGGEGGNVRRENTKDGQNLSCLNSFVVLLKRSWT